MRFACELLALGTVLHWSSSDELKQNGRRGNLPPFCFNVIHAKVTSAQVSRAKSVYMRLEIFEYILYFFSEQNHKRPAKGDNPFQKSGGGGNFLHYEEQNLVKHMKKGL